MKRLNGTFFKDPSLKSQSSRPKSQIPNPKGKKEKIIKEMNFVKKMLKLAVNLPTTSVSWM